MWELNTVFFSPHTYTMNQASRTQDNAAADLSDSAMQ